MTTSGQTSAHTPIHFAYQLTDHQPIFLNLHQIDTNLNEEKHKISFRIRKIENKQKFTGGTSHFIMKT